MPGSLQDRLSILERTSVSMRQGTLDGDDVLVGGSAVPLEDVPVIGSVPDGARVTVLQAGQDAVALASVGASETDWIDVYNEDGGQDAESAVILDLDTERESGGTAYTLNTGSQDTIDVHADGVALVDWGVTFVEAGASAGVALRAHLEHDSGSGYVDVPGTYTREWAGAGEISSVACAALVNLSDGDSLRVIIERFGGTGVPETEAASCFIRVVGIGTVGPKGDTGDTGATGADATPTNPNLLPLNSNGELLDDTNWVATNGEVTGTLDDALIGFSSTQVVADGSVQVIGVFPEGLQPVEPLQEYTGSCWVKMVEGVGETVQLRFRTYDSGKSLLASLPLVDAVSDGSWQRLVTTETLASDVEFVSLIVRVASPDADDEFLVAGMKLEEGGEDTPWNHPGPQGPIGETGPSPLTIGEVRWLAEEPSDAGLLLCDGAAVSRTTYDDLFDVLGTTWGSGDGSTTFNLPDLMQVFVRGDEDAAESGGDDETTHTHDSHATGPTGIVPILASGITTPLTHSNEVLDNKPAYRTLIPYIVATPAVGVQIIEGPQGPKGDPGDDGADGADGSTVLAVRSSTLGPVAALGRVELVVPFGTTLPNTDYTVSALMENDLVGAGNAGLVVERITTRETTQVRLQVYNEALSERSGEVHLIVVPD